MRFDEQHYNVKVLNKVGLVQNVRNVQDTPNRIVMMLLALDQAIDYNRQCKREHNST